MRLTGAEGLSGPLSAQAHAPDRPSGADKKEVQNEGESRPGRFGPRSDRAVIAANRHSLPSSYPSKVAPNGKRRVTRERLEREPSSGQLSRYARREMGQES